MLLHICKLLSLGWYNLFNSLMEHCFLVSVIYFFCSISILPFYFFGNKKNIHFFKCSVLIGCLNLFLIKKYKAAKISKYLFFLNDIGRWRDIEEWQGMHKWKYKRIKGKTEFYGKHLRAEATNDILSSLKDKCDKEKKKNVVFIEKGNDDKNTITYINDTLNNEVKEIKYLTDFQKNFIYLIERNSNLLLHAKTSSGKTTICLYYMILKFVHKCEFIFQEDIERKKYMLDAIHYENWKKNISNENKKYLGINKCLASPFSRKYTELFDLKADKRLLLEEKSKLKLKDDEKILILCPSKELCVQICHIILSLVGTKKEQIVKLFIDKERKTKLEKEMENGMANHTRNDNSIINLKNTMFLVGTPLCFKNCVLKMKKQNLKPFLKNIKYIFFDELDKLFPSIKKRSYLQKKKNVKKKNAHIILESIMYMNSKDTVFIGCSSTLNRSLHRSIFRLLCLNTFNRKKKMFLLREKRELQKEEKVEVEEKQLNDHLRNVDNILKSIGYNETDNIANQVSKYVIKVAVPNTIAHYYHVFKNESSDSKQNDLWKIIEHFRNKKILILIKNGCSLMEVKNFLESQNVCCRFLHEELEISLFENNKNRKKLSENYEKIKNIKPVNLEIEETGCVNEFPVIISSFDSIRGFHINDLDVVILFNKPKNINEYIHLSGRVGRRNKKGTSIILENEKNINIVKNWFNNLGVALNESIFTEQCPKEKKKEVSNETERKEWSENKETKENINKKEKQENQLNEINHLDYIKWALMNDLTEEDT